MNQPLLELKGITKRFPGVLALDNVDLEIRAGEVHTLLGENGAGKSTLIKILTGAYTADAGQIFIDGQEVKIASPRDAFAYGIAAIYQELSLVPQMTVAENVFLGREVKKVPSVGWLDRWEMNARASELLRSLGIEVDPRQKAGALGMGYKQMIEIARALAVNARLIIMDEPTSSLSEREVKRLLETVRSLRERGVAVIFISHRLEEVLAVSDRITVLRDGCKVATLDAAATNQDELIRLMVGRTLADKFPKQPSRRGAEALRIEGLSRAGKLHDISFTAYQGEILGIAGLVGAGRTELIRAIFGADPIDKGKIYVFGQPVTIKSPRDAIKAGMAFLTEDRKNQGLVLIQSVAFNMTLAGLNRFARYGWLNTGQVEKKSWELVRDLRVRPASIKYPVRLLSGGNQQKVVIGKWLCSGAKIFFFDEPTRGIDVGAKVEVYNLLNRLVAEGAAVIMVSSELPEILGMSDRILVMHEGRITAEFERSEATQEKIMKAATGGVPA